jgi:hypothetical protein
LLVGDEVKALLPLDRIEPALERRTGELAGPNPTCVRKFAQTEAHSMVSSRPHHLVSMGNERSFDGEATTYTKV